MWLRNRTTGGWFEIPDDEYTPNDKLKNQQLAKSKEAAEIKQDEELEKEIDKLGKQYNDVYDTLPLEVLGEADENKLKKNPTVAKLSQISKKINELQMKYYRPSEIKKGDMYRQWEKDQPQLVVTNVSNGNVMDREVSYQYYDMIGDLDTSETYKMKMKEFYNMLSSNGDKKYRKK